MVHIRSMKRQKFRRRKAEARVMSDMMDPIVTVNTTVNGNVSNVTESLTNQTQPTKESSEDEELARVLELVIRPVLIVFGTIGNGLSFYIMRQGSLKKMSTCFYLSILALTDTSVRYLYIMRQGSLKKMSTCFYLSILALAETSKSFVLVFPKCFHQIK